VDRGRIEALVVRFLDVMGLVEGPAHTEVIVTPDGPRIVESHNRPGGDGIIDLVQHACGLDVIGMTFDRLAGRPVHVRPDRHRAAAVSFLTAEPGRVHRVDGVAAARAVPGVERVEVTVGPGDVVRPLSCSADRCGCVLAVGATAEETLAATRQASALITIGTR
jgi:biotin carboxylase